MTVVESVSYNNLWRLLWSRAAHQVIEALPQFHGYTQVEVGYGIGLRNPHDPTKALILHPSGLSRNIGDLALTVVGQGTQVIPRYNRSYIEYLTDAIDAMEAAATILSA